MKKAVVSDTTPIRYLVKLNAVNILPELFSEVVIPPAVVSELSHPLTPELVRRWIATPPRWLKQRTPEVTLSIHDLGRGETEAIFLAEELEIDLLLMDERKASLVALNKGFNVIGTIGVLEAGASRGLIDFDEMVSRLLQTNFRLREEVIADAKKRLLADRTVKVEKT